KAMKRVNLLESDPDFIVELDSSDSISGFKACYT
ncbi:unnamed protein product, partial [marine sediment metagenome]